MLPDIIEHLVELVHLERSTSLDADEFNALLSEKAMVNLGYAIEGLYITNHQRDTIILTCHTNESRFRPGDKLTLSTPDHKPFSAILTKVQSGGLELHCTVKSKSTPTIAGPWLASEDQTNLSGLLITALRKLQPGVPGWGLVRKLFGENVVAPSPIFPTATIDADSVYKQLTLASNTTLDSSQLQVLNACLELPDLLGVQGPPGTGKTMLLGFVAESLARSNKRLLILAPTHQAVNNALSTIKTLFPDRRVVKVGDNVRTESLTPSVPIVSSNQELLLLPTDTIVGMTFFGALPRVMLVDKHPFSPNVVIIDEAGQLPLTQGVCSALCGAGTMFFFGDDRQMPPIYSGNIHDEELAVSVFAQLRKSRPSQIHMLSVTHRLNHELCQHVSGAFYSDAINQLHSSNLARNRRLELNNFSGISNPSIKRILDPSNSLIWVKVATDKCMQSNEPEASLVARIIETCLKSGMQSADIAVVTPFRRQARLITNILTTTLDKATQTPIIDTVERVQGATVDLVIFSFCASQLDYIGSLASFLFSPNRLNVAISRARRKSIFLSSPNIFNVLPLEHRGIVGRNTCRELLENSQDIMFSNVH